MKIGQFLPMFTVYYAKVWDFYFFLQQNFPLTHITGETQTQKISGSPAGFTETQGGNDHDQDPDPYHYRCPAHRRSGGSRCRRATTDIGVEKAKEAALSHAGVAESDTVFLIAEADYDDGRKEYEVEFYAGGTEYDYTIDAASGRVLKFDTELEWYSADDDAGYGWKNVIGKQKAQEIALADAGVAAEDALHLIVKPDWDDGVRIYEVEFYTAKPGV